MLHDALGCIGFTVVSKGIRQSRFELLTASRYACVSVGGRCCGRPPGTSYRYRDERERRLTLQVEHWHQS